MKRGSLVAAIVGALVLNATPTLAQVGWESPMLASPRGQVGIGVFLIEPAGGDLGAMATWRRSPTGFGLRGGLAEDAFDQLAVFAGLDWRGGLVRQSAEFPLDVSWLVGAGGSFGEYGLISVPAGVTLGRTFSGEGLTFTPYLTPRLVLDLFLGDFPGDDTELDVVADLGLDLHFQPGWLMRFGVTLGDRDEALAIGVAF